MGDLSGPASLRTPHPALDAFDARAAAWEDYTATPLGRLREELTRRYLARHVDASPPALDVLDVGGGTGGYALALARAGHRVCLLDFSASMLDIARAKATQLGPDLAGRIEFRVAPAQDIPRLFAPHRFHLILCHTLLEYVAEPGEVLAAMSAVLRPGGLLSLLFVNPHADPLRWAIARGDLGRARLALEGELSAADLFGLPRRAYTARDMERSLRRVGLDVAACYGVRVLADYLPAEKLADQAYWERLLELETLTGARSPYIEIARYNLLLAKKREAS